MRGYEGVPGLSACVAGNTELLETTYTRPQVLPRRRGPEVTITGQLHPGVFGGQSWTMRCSIMDANAESRAGIRCN